MKKTIYLVLLLSLSVYANSIQVFTANIMHLKLNKDLKFEQIFLEDMETYIKISNFNT